MEILLSWPGLAKRPTPSSVSSLGIQAASLAWRAAAAASEISVGSGGAPDSGSSCALAPSSAPCSQTLSRPLLLPESLPAMTYRTALPRPVTTLSGLPGVGQPQGTSTAAPHTPGTQSVCLRAQEQDLF